VHRVVVPYVPITSVPDPQARGRDGVSIKGGAWPNNSGSLASPVHPPGLENDELSGGGGNNQSSFYAPKGSLKRGDYVVLRPKHAGRRDRLLRRPRRRPRRHDPPRLPTLRRPAGVRALLR
jgi:hypothetical protein